MKRLAIPIAFIVLAYVLLRALFAMSVVDQLLGAARPSAGAAVLLLVFYSVRLTVFFVIPGWIVFILASAAGSASRQPPRASSPEAPDASSQ